MTDAAPRRPHRVVAAAVLEVGAVEQRVKEGLERSELTTDRSDAHR